MNLVCPSCSSINVGPTMEGTVNMMQLNRCKDCGFTSSFFPEMNDEELAAFRLEEDKVPGSPTIPEYTTDSSKSTRTLLLILFIPGACIMILGAIIERNPWYLVPVLVMAGLAFFVYKIRSKRSNYQTADYSQE